MYMAAELIVIGVAAERVMSQRMVGSFSKDGWVALEVFAEQSSVPPERTSS
jgi:hypothetical protein